MKSILIHAVTGFDRLQPFEKPYCNKAYSIFLQEAKKLGISAHISRFSYFNPKTRTISKAWTFDESWKIIEDIPVDLLYYKAGNELSQDVLKLSIESGLKVVNHPKLSLLCDDKVATALTFKDISAKTFIVNTKDDLVNSLKSVTSSKVVLKPRFGSQGKDIFVYDTATILTDVTEILPNTILQEFIDTSEGIPKLNIKGYHDLRLMIINGKIHHAYVRIAAKGSYTCNMTRGASKQYFKVDELPSSIIELSKKIDSKLKKYKTRIYSADFFFSNGKPMLVELNSKPGTLYYDDHPKLRLDYYVEILNALKCDL